MRLCIFLHDAGLELIGHLTRKLEIAHSRCEVCALTMATILNPRREGLRGWLRATTVISAAVVLSKLRACVRARADVCVNERIDWSFRDIVSNYGNKKTNIFGLYFYLICFGVLLYIRTEEARSNDRLGIVVYFIAETL